MATVLSYKSEEEKNCWANISSSVNVSVSSLQGPVILWLLGFNTTDVDLFHFSSKSFHAFYKKKNIQCLTQVPNMNNMAIPIYILHIQVV